MPSRTQPAHAFIAGLMMPPRRTSGAAFLRFLRLTKALGGTYGQTPNLVRRSQTRASRSQHSAFDQAPPKQSGTVKKTDRASQALVEVTLSNNGLQKWHSS